LAQLSLDGDEPWANTDVLRLTITDDGATALGLPAGLYPGEFDATENGFTMDAAMTGLIGNLGLNGTITDNEPPDASRVQLFTGTKGIGKDRIFVTSPTNTGVGDWTFNPVPEPGSLGLAVMAMVGVGSYRRRRHG